MKEAIDMEQVRVGVIGLGMGFSHAKSLAAGRIAGRGLAPYATSTRPSRKKRGLRSLRT